MQTELRLHRLVVGILVMLALILAALALIKRRKSSRTRIVHSKDGVTLQENTLRKRNGVIAFTYILTGARSQEVKIYDDFADAWKNFEEEINRRA